MMNNKIYLTNAYQQPVLLRQLFKQAKTAFVQVQVLDIDRWLKLPDEALNQELWIVKTMALVHDQYDKLEFYQGVDGSLAFAEQLLRVFRQLLSYRCDFSIFPTDTKANRDLALLLNKMQEWKVRESYLLKALHSGVSKDGVEVYQYQTIHPLELELLEQLGYQPQVIANEQLEYYQSLNDYEQLEWVAQDIVSHGYPLDQVHISCPVELQQPLMSVLRRYKIWDGVLGPAKVLQLGRALNRIAHNAYQVSELLVVARLLGGIKAAGILEQYVLLTKPQVKDFMNPFTALNNHSRKQLVSLYDRAESVRQQLVAWLLPVMLWNTLDWVNYAQAMFGMLNPLATSLAERRVLNALKHKWQSLPPETKLGIDQLMEHSIQSLELIDFAPVQLTSLGLRVDAMVHYSIGQQHGTFLPNYTFNTLIDETTVSQLEILPISDRKNIAFAYAKAGYSASQRLVLLTSQIKADGKPISRNIELQDYFALPSPILVEPKLPFFNFLPLNVQRKISTQQAQAIYHKNGRLYGSVSSFEKYNQCQYAYFISYGLRVKPLEHVEMEVNIVGIILHRVLENLVKQHSSRYSRATPDDYQTLLDDALSDFRSIAAYQPVIYGLVKDALVRQLAMFLKGMARLEAGSLMIPSELEYSYTKDFDFGLTLTGIIDRIDVYPQAGWFSIIDYKSSGKGFSALEFINGLQLQLATYLMVTIPKFGEPLGAAYQTLKYSVLRKPAYDLSAAKAKTYTDIIANKQMEAYQRNGISLARAEQARLELLSNNGLLFDGIKVDKNNDLKASNKVDYDQHELFTVLEAVYRNTANQIMAGNIDLNPKEGSCTYCEYLPICQFKGVAKKLPKVLGLKNNALSGGMLVSARYGEIINE